jgi:Ca-activated chloride channel family protein
MRRFIKNIDRLALILALSAATIHLCASVSLAEDSPGLLEKGNRLYKQKKYDEAIKLYNEAQIKSPDSPEISYNIGIAQYKKEDYEPAISHFEKATVSRDRMLEAKANFNIGNAKYKLGKLKENTDLNQTIELLRQGLDYYKRAIELDPKDEDAKINHELVEKELKALMDKSKQQQDKQKGQAEEKQGNRGQEEQEEQKERPQGETGSGKQEDARKDSGAAKQEESGSEDEKEQEPGVVAGAEKAGGEKQPGQEETAMAEERGQMSEEEANMLLDGYRQEESSAGKLEDRGKGRFADVLKDW